MSINQPPPQMAAQADNALSQAHTDIHRALEMLRGGGSSEGVKRLVAKAVEKAVNAMAVL